MGCIVVIAMGCIVVITVVFILHQYRNDECLWLCWCLTFIKAEYHRKKNLEKIFLLPNAFGAKRNGCDLRRTSGKQKTFK